MSNSSEKAKASELLENPEEVFPRFYMHGNVTSRFESSTTQLYVTRRERVNCMCSIDMSCLDIMSFMNIVIVIKYFSNWEA